MRELSVAKTQIVCSTNANGRLTNSRDESAIILSGGAINALLIRMTGQATNDITVVRPRRTFRRDPASVDEWHKSAVH